MAGVGRPRIEGQPVVTHEILTPQQFRSLLNLRNHIPNRVRARVAVDELAYAKRHQAGIAVADQLPHGPIDCPFGLKPARFIQGSKHRGMPRQPMHLIHHRGRRIAPQIFEALAPEESVFAEHGAAHREHIALLKGVFVVADTQGSTAPSSTQLRITHLRGCEV